MTAQARIVLRNLHLPCTIGHYPAEVVAPDLHLLDLILSIAPDHILVSADEMSQVFDYDPLLHEIGQLVFAQHYTTQEYLLTRIVQACAAYPRITALEVQLHKSPVLGGSAGVHLVLGTDDLGRLREKAEWNVRGPAIRQPTGHCVESQRGDAADQDGPRPCSRLPDAALRTHPDQGFWYS